MKKLYMVALALVLISPFAFVNANENGEREQKKERAWFQMSEEKRDAMKERQELMKEKMEEHREEWKEKREDFRREHAQVFIERIKAHFEWAIKWTQNIHDLSDINKHTLKEMEHFFSTYKKIQDKHVEVLGFKDAAAAKAAVLEGLALYEAKFPEKK